MKLLNSTAALALGTIFVGCNGTGEFEFPGQGAASLQAGQLEQLTLVSAEIPDTITNRRIEARRYLEVCDPAEMMKETAKSMAATMPQTDGDELLQIFSKHLDMKGFENTMLNCMCNHFTASELRALADFYGSPVGKSARAKFGPYMAEAMPQVNRLIEDALRNHASSR